MNRYGLIIGGLIVAVAGLAAGLGFALMEDDDGMHHNGGGYAGMMGAMGNMDSEAMLAPMREVLSESDYELMVAHMSAHRDGSAMPQDQHMDQMMHGMMDGMMAELR